jgi:hypothetical protein
MPARQSNRHDYNPPSPLVQHISAVLALALTIVIETN